MKSPAARCGLLLLATLPFAAAPAAAQRFEFRSGAVVTAGQPLDIHLSGLPADAEVEVRASRVIRNHWQRGAPLLPYRSTARFRADAAGNVDLGRSPSLGGSYTGADPSGLFWSMVPVRGASAVTADDEVSLVASLAGRPIAAGSFRMPSYAGSLPTRSMPGFPGSYFAASSGFGRRPVIIIVDGEDSNGYNRDTLVPRLAASGFAVVHFATYSLVYGGGRPAVEGLPTRYVDIAVDRLQAVRDWLVRQPEVDGNRIGLYGVSRNGAYVLIAATRFSWVRAVAAIVPSDVVWEGWGDGVPLGTTSSYAWRGRPLPFVPYSGNFHRETARLARGQRARLRTPMDEGRWANPGRIRGARIPVERYSGALFLAGGEQDDVWSSGHMVQNIAERRAEAGLATTFLIFPDAGHNLGGDGWTPTMLFEQQGEARAIEARAQYRTWHALVDFFRRSLRPEQTR